MKDFVKASFRTANYDKVSEAKKEEEKKKYEAREQEKVDAWKKSKADEADRAFDRKHRDDNPIKKAYHHIGRFIDNF